VLRDETKDRGWVRAIGRELRDDFDVPTLPEEMLDLLEQMRRTTAAKSNGGNTRDWA
jgi:hypothetical protein